MLPGLFSRKKEISKVKKQIGGEHKFLNNPFPGSLNHPITVQMGVCMKRRVWLIPVVFAGLMLSLGAFAQNPGKIEISKMNPAGLLVDKYSYMAQPYNFYIPPHGSTRFANGLD